MSTQTSSSDPPSNSAFTALHAPPHVHALLDRLHALSIQQEAELPSFLRITAEKGATIKPASAKVGSTTDEGTNEVIIPVERSAPSDTATQSSTNTQTASSNTTANAPMTAVSFDALMRDKIVALDRPKCQFMYTLLRAMRAKTVVEIGTSYGVSTIYAALAVSQNYPAGTRHGGGKPVVIATEYEPEKAKGAREYWKEAGEDVSRVIELREGDLLQTLAKDLPDEIDFVLLDVWAPIALPALQLLIPHLRRGAMIFTDNAISSKIRYRDLLTVLRNPEGPWRTVTVPYENGLEISVYEP